MSSTHRHRITMRFMLYTLIFSFRNRPTYSRISTLCDHYNAVHSIKGYVICCGLRLIKPRAMGKIFLLNEINNQNDGFRLNPFFYINSIVAFIAESCEKVMKATMEYAIEINLLFNVTLIFCQPFSAMHMARHLQPDAFQCPTCEKLMTCPKILQYHIQNHLPEKDRPLACPVCPRKFSYSSALVAHAISHQPENERAAHICDECGKSFSSPGRLSSHINVAHINHAADYICHICAKQFSCRSNLTYHLTTHQPKIHQVQCTTCGKWLKNKLCLRKVKMI